MRTVAFPDRTQANVDLDALRERGPVGVVAANFLAVSLTEERLVLRSFVLYLGVLRDLAEHYAGEPWHAVTSESLARFLATYSAGKAWRARLARVVLRQVLRTAPGSKHITVPPMTAELEAATGPTVDQLAAVDREAEYVLRSTFGRLYACVATADEVLRAGLVAMCRHGGATAIDLVEMTLDDIGDHGSWQGTIGTTWRAGRVSQQGVGAAKAQEFAITLPRVVRHAIERWLAMRGPVIGSDKLWARPMTDPEGVTAFKPLTRRDVFDIVAGIGDPTSGEAHVAEFPALQTEPDTAPTRIEISPSLLRHCLALEIVRATPTQAALIAAMGKRMGVAGRGLGSRYRKMLQIPRVKVAAAVT